MKVLQDLWVIDANGVVLYKRVFDEKLNDQLFGGFMSALNSFASQLDSQGLSSFDLGAKKFILLKKDTLFFVSNFDKKLQPKKAQKELESVASEFLHVYTVELVAWDGNVTTFENFGDHVRDSFEDVVDNFEKAFW